MKSTGEWKPSHDIKYDGEEEELPPVEERIPKTLSNNFYLGDLLELVIDLKYPSKQRVK